MMSSSEQHSNCPALYPPCPTPDNSMQPTSSLNLPDDIKPPNALSPLPRELYQMKDTPRKANKTKVTPMNRCRTRLVEIMTPTLDLNEDPILQTSGQLLDKVVKAVGRSQERSSRKALREYRQLLRKHVDRMQQNDLSNAREFYRTLVSDTDCEMTKNFLKLINKEIMSTIQKVHAGILTEFKIFPNLEHQKAYSDQLAKVAYGWRMTNFLDKNDKIVTQYGYV